MRDLMADFVFVQHGDLHSMLLDLATREGVEFRYNAPVAGVDCDTVSVTLEGGERLYADLVVGADGHNSLVRNAVVGQQVTGVRDGQMSLTTSIPTAEMRDDEDLRPLTEDTDVCIPPQAIPCTTNTLTVVGLARAQCHGPRYSRGELPLTFHEVVMLRLWLGLAYNLRPRHNMA